MSGLGKGITAASIGLLLKSYGLKISLMKCDMYLNIDAGTMNPVEHGEVFVTHDGLETDQDLGHYERFTGITLNRANYLTNGQIYQHVLDMERSLSFGGVCVEPYHHIPPEIIKKWEESGKSHNADITIIELGGTVGEYEGLLFFEAYRRLKLEKPNDVCLVHVGYLPAPNSLGELKSKPMQQSIIALNSLGIQPDFVIGRAQKDIDLKRKEKISYASGLPIENIISNPDMDSVYFVPIKLATEKIAKKIIKKLKIKAKSSNLGDWISLINKIKQATREVDIAVIGKYQKTGEYILSDTYVSVIEALKHAGYEIGVKPNPVWIDSESLETLTDEQVKNKLSKYSAIVVPQGWGKRGVEGKIKAIKYARENNVPYLGLCFGMQMAVIEFARNVLGMRGANTAEADPKTKYPVIHTMPDQLKYLQNHQYGGTIRLGAYPCKLKNGSVLFKAYEEFGQVKNAPWFVPREDVKHKSQITNHQSLVVHERHRHRYEFNNKYKKQFEDKGMIISGVSPDGKLVEAVELKGHKFFVGTQFHPEYISRPLTPHPIFISFLKSAAGN